MQRSELLWQGKESLGRDVQQAHTQARTCLEIYRARARAVARKRVAEHVAIEQSCAGQLRGRNQVGIAGMGGRAGIG